MTAPLTYPQVVYSQQEAADRLGLSRWTIRRAISGGDLVAHQKGHYVYIFASDLLDYVLRLRGGDEAVRRAAGEVDFEVHPKG